MGLSAGLGRLAARRLHVLLTEPAGGFEVRARAERACVQRGWVIASSPADADVLLVCGDGGGEHLAAAIERTWTQLPGPRARHLLAGADGLDLALDGVAQSYRDWVPSATVVDPAAHGMDHGEMDHGAAAHGMDHGDMDHGDMHMSGPGGLPLASGADDDRDGLEMDVLHLPLGPVLPSWPAGLAVVLTLAGDVVTAVEVRVADAAPANHAAAYRLDAAARLLELAGAGELAGRARVGRDRLLDGEGFDPAHLRRTVERARVLRWSLRRVGVVAAEDATGRGWPSAWEGDAHDRLLRLLHPLPDTGSAPTTFAPIAPSLPALLSGSELGSAQLTVASLVGHPVDASTTSDPSRTGVTTAVARP